VRTPLNHIINYLEMALEGPLDDDTRESLVRSHSASRALVHVINDLLDLTRTESNQNMFLQDPLDLSNTIDEAVAIHRLEAQRRGVAFEVIENPSGTPQTLLGDRGKIRQIVANVTANAVKHTKQGRVTVEWGEMSKDSADPAEASQDTIKIGISVTDTGAGIPEDQLEEMFRTFEQVETDDGDSQQLKSPAGNLGLGLAVVARIVSQLGGQLRVESKVGHGSKFTFVLHFRLPGPQASSTATHSVGTASDGRDSVGRILTDSSAAKSLQKANSTNSLSGSYISKQMSNDSKPSDIESLVEVISGNHMSVPPSTHRHTEHGEVELRPRVAKPGQVEIEDSGTPLRSVKIDEGDVEVPAIRAPGSPASRPNTQRKKTGTDRPANPAYAATGSVSRPGPAKRASTNLSIPRAPDSATQSATTSATPSSAPPPSTQPLRIMIVEDDAINRAILLKKLTRDFHHKVSSTVHGEEAVRLFEKDRNFDMILMDLQ
jgi:CheY-like chemotaxis protein